MGSAAGWMSLVVVGAGLLGGCGRPNAYSLAPEAIRLPKPQPRPPEPEPDVAKLLQDGHDSIFAKGSEPKNVMIAKARHDPSGPGWLFCAKANVKGANGALIGVQTLVVYVEQGRVGFRRPAEPSDNCQSESYQRL